MCPVHHFVPVPSCPLCGSFAGGFVGGFLDAPAKWARGAGRIGSQGGAILSRSGRSEEEENRLIGQEIRAVYRLYTRNDLAPVHDAWQQLPPMFRQRLVESGYQGLGSAMGGIAASQVFIFGLGYGSARMITTVPVLRSLLAARVPASIAASTILSLISLHGSIAQIIANQRQLFEQYPGSEEALKSVLDKTTRDKS